MISKTDRKYFIKARHIADLSDFRQTHIGCVAVYHGKVIGIGFNMNKTHPLQKHYNEYRDENIIIPKLHAEISCISSIRHLDINFSKVKLYIYRTRCDQDYGISRPCQGCMVAIKDLGIKHIYYTTNDGYAYEYIGRF